MVVFLAAASAVGFYVLPPLLRRVSDLPISQALSLIHISELGRNMCYHRLLRLDGKRFAARIVENRGTYTRTPTPPTATTRLPASIFCTVPLRLAIM